MASLWYQLATAINSSQIKKPLPNMQWPPSANRRRWPKSRSRLYLVLQLIWWLWTINYFGPCGGRIGRTSDSRRGCRNACIVGSTPDTPVKQGTIHWEKGIGEERLRAKTLFLQLKNLAHPMYVKNVSAKLSFHVSSSKYCAKPVER